MQQTPWLQRQFNYGSSQDILAATLERLAGTPLRLIDKLSRIPDELLVHRPAANQWSIQEHAGHLLDLESHWVSLMEDILTGKENLRQQDISNKQTDLANHNASELEDLLVNFTLFRRQTVDTLAILETEQLELSAMHPRLKQPMNIGQLSLYIADHDDHHLARITQLMMGQ